VSGTGITGSADSSSQEEIEPHQGASVTWTGASSDFQDVGHINEFVYCKTTNY